MRKLTILLLILYIVLNLYNLAALYFGLPYHPFFTPMLTLLAFTFALLHSSQTLGWKRALLLLFLTFAVSLLFESVGVATGWIYGPYHYTDKLGPKFLGLVPLLIPVAWFMMTYPSYMIATHIVPVIKQKWLWRLAVAALGGIIMTAWDLAMDPMMVAGNHWVWDVPGAYFGVPLQNYWGWYLTIFVTFLLYLALAHEQPVPATTNGYTNLAAASYATTGISVVLVDFILHIDGPALVGLFAMLPWMVLATIKRERIDLNHR